MRTPFALAGFALALLAPSAIALAEGHTELIRADLPGRAIFTHQCAPCHGAGPGDDASPMLPGTAALEEKYQGRLPGELELRSDLSAPIITIFVRRGSGAMPSFRPSELSDADIAAIADYLAETARLSHGAEQ